MLAAVARVGTRWPLHDPATPDLLAPREDLVGERLEPDGSYAAVAGPFRSYRRTVTVDDAAAVAEERTEFRLAVPWFGWLYTPLTRRALALAASGPTATSRGGHPRTGSRRPGQATVLGSSWGRRPSWSAT